MRGVDNMKLQVTKTFQMFDKEVIEKYSEVTGWFNPDRPLSKEAMTERLKAPEYTL